MRLEVDAIISGRLSLLISTMSRAETPLKPLDMSIGPVKLTAPGVEVFL